MKLLTKVSLGSAACCCITVSLVILIVVLSNYSTLEHDELAVSYNSLTKSIDRDEVYDEGRHPIGPTSSFIKYTRTQQTLEMSGENEVECLTREGLSMEMDITVNYQIVKDQLFNIFDEFGEEDNYRPYLVSITRDAVKDACSNFTGEDFFSQRGAIGQLISAKLADTYVVSNAYASLGSVEVRNVRHPGPYEKANQEKQSTEQERDRVLRQRDELLTKVQTELLKAQVEADIVLIHANATAEALLVEAESLAPAETKKWEERADAFKAIKAGMGPGTTNQQFIEHYMRYYVLTQQEKPIITLQET